MITYKIDRWNRKDYGIVGDLWRGDQMLGFTLEPPENRALYPAIPFGTYHLAWVKSPKLGVYTPRLLDVPGRSGILIHAGNTVSDTDGCILVGTGWSDNGSFYLNNSAVMRDKVYALMEEDIREGYAEIEVLES